MTALEPRWLAGFADIDRHFARFIARFGGGEPILLAAAALSRAVRSGHVCIDLTTTPADLEIAPPGPWPALDEWRRILSLSRAVGGADSVSTPLVFDAAGRLYLRRYYNYEQRLAAALRLRGSPKTDAPREGQTAAIEAALSQPLTVISGGPGTGKTTTVVTILARFLEKQPGSRIALCAPTGKAAARLEQAVREGFAKLPAAPVPPERLPRAATLHRLLGFRPNASDFRHHAGNPLALDVLVVDEASMVPLPVMAKLFDALPQPARVILLGDRDQLASVEPGSVLADLADAAQSPNQANCLGGVFVTLRKNYRFGNDSAIFRLCEAVRSGDSQAALRIALAPAQPGLGSSPLPPPAALLERLGKPVLEGFGPYLRETDPGKALAAFNRFRVLCAPRQGPYGVEELNRQIAAILHRTNRKRAGRIYAGMPVLVTRNDYQLNLFNGDIGILLPDPDGPEPQQGEEPPLWAWFAGEGASPVRRISPARLPEHGPAYAMTVHKSQGSEFDRVLMVLPERDLPILTRELIYTGLTRAKSRVDVWFNQTVFENSVARGTRRESGLRERMEDER